MHNRHPPLTTTTTGHDGSVRLELDKQGVGRRMREGIDDKAFPEQGAKVSIHSDGSFEGLGCFGEYKPKRSDCRFLLVHAKAR